MRPRKYEHCKLCDKTTARTYKTEECMSCIRKAHKKVEVALRNGSLTKMPCEMCFNEKSEAHHHNYHKPLDIMWLCRKCHRKEHTIT